MQEENILDIEIPEEEEKKIYKFQIIEFVLVGLFLSLMLLRTHLPISKIAGAISIFPLLILAYMLFRIYLEYKNKLITGFGVVLKIYLFINVAVVFFGVLFKIMNWDYAAEMFIVGLSSMAYPYAIYAITLKNVSIPIKVILFFNAAALGVLLIGVLFKIESWPNGQEMLITGLTASLLTLLSFGFLLKMNLTNKERYHALTYFARMIAVLIFGFGLIW